jgi:hypothetical protein
MASVLSTQYFSGSASAPAAGTAFCTIPAANLRRVGVYRIKAQVCYTGAALGAPEQTVGATPGNVGLFLGATNAGSIGMPAVSGVFMPFSFTAELDGLSLVSLNSIATPTASVLYWGILEADFLGSQGGLGEFTE